MNTRVVLMDRMVAYTVWILVAAGGANKLAVKIGEWMVEMLYTMA